MLNPIVFFGKKEGILGMEHQNEILSLTAVTCWAFTGYDWHLAFLNLPMKYARLMVFENMVEILFFKNLNFLIYFNYFDVYWY